MQRLLATGVGGRDRAATNDSNAASPQQKDSVTSRSDTRSRAAPAKPRDDLVLPTYYT